MHQEGKTLHYQTLGEGLEYLKIRVEQGYLHKTIKEINIT